MASSVALCTPIVFIIFRRPDVTAQVFEQIRLAKPQQLFIIADGPRNQAESTLCKQTRSITEHIDWPCTVVRDYAEGNLGCRKRVVSGVNKAFETVETAIVLEDDCLPGPDFFNFCQILLQHYQDDERVWMISGNNFQNGRIRGDGSYYFSRYPHCWGWATWKRAWNNYEDDLVTWPEFRDSGLMKSVFENPREARYWVNIFDALTLHGKPDSWAYRWTYACWSGSGLTALPNQNLVANLGFGHDSTNTNNFVEGLANLPINKILPIHHPTFVIRDAEADSYTAHTIFLSSPISQILGKIKGKMKREVKRIFDLTKKNRTLQTSQPKNG